MPKSRLRTVFETSHFQFKRNVSETFLAGTGQKSLPEHNSHWKSGCIRLHPIYQSKLSYTKIEEDRMLAS